MVFHNSYTITFTFLPFTTNPVVYFVLLASACSHHKNNFGCRAFSPAAPQIWNHIPTAIGVSQSLDSFKRHLKTHYSASP